MMTANTTEQAASLRRILAAIEAELPETGVDDIASFILAGEFGLAADTIFCAISEEAIAVDEETLRDLETVADLFNTFGDLNADIAAAVLERTPRSGPVMR